MKKLNLIPSEVNIALDRFQFRTEPFNQEKVDWMVANWNNDILDPIDVWHDEDGKHWLISGHHRLAAATQLQAEKIPARVHRVTLNEARMMAMASNANRLQYTPIEYCNCMEFLVDVEQMTKAAAAEKLTVSPTLAAKYYSLRHLKNTDWEAHLHVAHIAVLGYEVAALCEKHPCTPTELNSILNLILTHELRLAQVTRLVNDMRKAKSAPVAEQANLFDISSYSADRVAQVIHERTYTDKLWQRVWFMYKLLENPADGCDIPEDIAEPLKLQLRRLNAYLTDAEESEVIPVGNAKKLRGDFAESINN
jgi:ParB/RepB/Spo0J family partition protein